MKKIVAVILLIFVAFLILYFGQPVLNYGFVQLPILILLLLLIGIILFTKLGINPANKQLIIKEKPSKIFKILIVLVLTYVIVLPLVTSLPMFRSESYRNLIGEVKDGNDLKKHIAPISLDEIRVVDERLALLLGEKIIGSQPSLGSQAEIGAFTIQKVNEKLYWVAPLLHTGFLKWFNNSEGTPGYVMVSATNERDVKLVQEINGKSVKIKYQPEAFFGSEIERHVYFSGYTTIGLTDFSFEIDDAGNPFWVVTTYKKEIGFGGSDATGTLVVNAQTGEITQYSITDTPLWVDRIQPLHLIEEQLSDWGEYVQGY